MEMGMKVHLPTLFSSVALSVLALLLCLALLSSPLVQEPGGRAQRRFAKAVQITGKAQTKAAKAGPPKAGPKAIRHFVYACPPKTGSLITRGELRRFCRQEGLSCLGQHDPCVAMGSCPLNSTAPALKEELDSIFWAAFTFNRLRECCPKALKTQFSAAMFHPYLADPPTRDFFHSQTPEDAVWFTILRNPVDQFISFFNWVTRAHRRLYFYIPLVREKKDLDLDSVVALWHEHLVQDRLGELPPGHLHLYRTLTNIQSRILGWDGTPTSLRETISSLRRMDFVGLTEEIGLTWRLLRKKLGWPQGYLDEKILRKPTLREVGSTLRQRILEIQAADVKLYKEAKALFAKAKKDV